MNILILGKGGREYAIYRALSRPNTNKDKLYILHNKGAKRNFNAIEIPFSEEEIKQISEKSLNDWIDQESIEMIIAGDESFIFSGLYDKLKKNKKLFLCIPSESAARLESSKLYAKELMNKLKIPTAAYKVIKNKEEIKTLGEEFNDGYVIKFSGPAMGKGVILDTAPEVEKDAFFQEYLNNKVDNIFVEKKIEGKEISFFFMIDSYNILPLIAVKDYKKRLNHGKGSNTGGMGALAPYYNEYLAYVNDTIVKPIVDELKERKIFYKGIMYVGAIIDKDNKIIVLEFNVRFGDPETQALLKLLNFNLKELIIDLHNNNLSKYKDKEIFKKDCFAVTQNVVYKDYPYLKASKLDLDINLLTLLEKKYNLYIDFYKLGYSDNDIKKAFLEGGRLFSITSIEKSIVQAKEKINLFLNELQLNRDLFDFRDDIGTFNL